MMAIDYFAVLGVAVDAAPAAIRSAYKRLAQHFHPDKSPGPGAEAHMKLLNEAYRVLSDPRQRAAHARACAAHTLAGGRLTRYAVAQVARAEHRPVGASLSAADDALNRRKLYETFWAGQAFMKEGCGLSQAGAISELA